MYIVLSLCNILNYYTVILSLEINIRSCVLQCFCMCACVGVGFLTDNQRKHTRYTGNSIFLIGLVSVTLLIVLVAIQEYLVSTVSVN